MKILLVTPIHWPTLWEKQKVEELARYGEIRTPLLIGQAQYFWWKAVRQLGHEVKVCRYSDLTAVSHLVQRAEHIARWLPFFGRRLRDRLQTREFTLRDRRVIDAARKYQPHLVIITAACRGISAETVRSLKESTGAKLILIDGTSPVVFATPEQKRAAPYYDCVFNSDYYHSIQWLELGAPQSLVLPASACDPEYHRPYSLNQEEKTHYASDICFVGRLAPPRLYGNRVRVLEALVDFDLGIWTDDEAEVRSHPNLSRFYRGRAYDLEMLKVLSASKIALNVHGIFVRWGGNLRMFEIPATATFQLVDRYDPAWFQEGDEIVSFNGGDDLRKKVRYYLDHDDEREVIAKRGQERVYRDHTYLIRMSRLIEQIESQADGSPNKSVWRVPA